MMLKTRGALISDCIILFLFEVIIDIVMCCLKTKRWTRVTMNFDISESIYYFSLKSFFSLTHVHR